MPERWGHWEERADAESVQRARDERACVERAERAEAALTAMTETARTLAAFLAVYAADDLQRLALSDVRPRSEPGRIWYDRVSGVRTLLATPTVAALLSKELSQ